MKKLGALIALTLLAAAPALAQDATPFFRVINGGVNADGSAIPPPGNTNDNGGPTGVTDQDGNLVITYSDVAGTYGADYESVPVIPPGYAPHDFSFNWPSPDPSDAEIDPNTGVITWHAHFKGTVTASVGATVSDTQGALGSAKISVPTDYAIVTTPTTYTQQLGSINLSQSFVATTVPAQASSGEVWTAQYVGNELPQVGNVITFSSDDNMLNGYVSPDSSPEKFRFVRTDASGVKTYGDWVDINVTPWPTFSYASATTTDYQVEDNNYMQIKLGATVDIPASKLWGATHLASASGVPWASIYSGDLVLPPGLTMDTDGRIHGTVGGTSHSQYNLFSPVANNDESAYGALQGAIFVVDAIQSNIWNTCYTNVNSPQDSQTPQNSQCHDDGQDPPNSGGDTGGGSPPPDTGHLVGTFHAGLWDNGNYRVTGTSVEDIGATIDGYVSMPDIVAGGETFTLTDIGEFRNETTGDQFVEVRFAGQGDPNNLINHTLTVGGYVFHLGADLPQQVPGSLIFFAPWSDEFAGDYVLNFD